jgi:hypothetical protein
MKMKTLDEWNIPIMDEITSMWMKKCFKFLKKTHGRFRLVHNLLTPEPIPNQKLENSK